MNNKGRQKYEKPILKGEKIFEALAGCCKDPRNCGTAQKNKNFCGGAAPLT
jgi:hypothetical protein